MAVGVFLLSVLPFRRLAPPLHFFFAREKVMYPVGAIRDALPFYTYRYMRPRNILVLILMLSLVIFARVPSNRILITSF